MNQKDVNRKLTCILSTDVVGYSRLMEENEASTVKYLEENKQLISKLIDDYNGRVVDSPGDNLLAEFNSAVNAVDCAVRIQKELKIKNADLVENKRMQFRIGINLGEVIEEDGRIYGSGVNIAARLEGLAEPEGICISKKVYDEIKTKLDLEYDYLGEHEVKNITELVQVYRVQTGFVNRERVTHKKFHVGLSGKIAFAAILIIVGLFIWRFYPSKPAEKAPKTIAVLPFDDLSPEKDQEYFVLGLSEEILNSLDKIPDLTVIAKTSSFSFRGSNKTIQEIAKEVGADHILEGSVRKSGNAIRITAQLIKAGDESHLWSETYDKNLEVKELFAVQEDIANNVADKFKLTLESYQLLGGTENIKAYELYLVALGQYYKYEYSQALNSIEAAITLDSEFALAWALKSLIKFMRSGLFPLGKESNLEFNESLECALEAIELEPNLGKAWLILGTIQSSKKEIKEAEKSYQKGIELTTESIDYFEYGLTLHYWSLGYLKKCRELLEEMMHNDPLHRGVRLSYILILGYLGDVQEVENEYERFKAIFGASDVYITLARLGSKDAISIEDISETVRTAPVWRILFNYLESPKKGLIELHRLYSNEDNITINDFHNMACIAAYFDDPEFAMELFRKAPGSNIRSSWNPVMHEARQLPQFKEFVQEKGFVDYWREYGWPDLCRPIGDDDFECD